MESCDGIKDHEVVQLIFFQVKYKVTGYCAGGRDNVSILMICSILGKRFGDAEASKLQFFVKK